MDLIPLLISFIISLILCLLGAYLVFYRIKNSRVGAIIILGLPNSGKTALFHQLVNNRMVQTLMSQRVSNKSIDCNGRVLDLIDIPGHPTTRGQWMLYLARCVGVIFLIDSSAIHLDLYQCSEFLLDVLMGIHGRSVSVLICCNKSDLSREVLTNLIKTMLVSEMKLLINGERTREISDLTEEYVSKAKRNTELKAIDRMLDMDNWGKFVSVSVLKTDNMNVVKSWINERVT